MNELLGRVFRFQDQVFPEQSALFDRLTREGQSPTALMISCADSRVVPEQIVQAAPGDLFVCRNAGNIVPPYSEASGGVTSTVEYAVAVLKVTDIIVCGHSDCGAMKALNAPHALGGLPNVAAWLHHAQAAEKVVQQCYPDLAEADRVRAISLENVATQLAHLRTHPSVAASLARGEITLHGWFVDIHVGEVLGLDGETGRFRALRADAPLPVAHRACTRLAADFDLPYAVAAE